MQVWAFREIVLSETFSMHDSGELSHFVSAVTDRRKAGEASGRDWEINNDSHAAYWDSNLPRNTKKAFGLVGSTPTSVLDDSAPGLFSSPGGAAGGRRFRPRAPAGSASASFVEEEFEVAAATGRPPVTYGLAAMGHSGGGMKDGAPPIPAMHSALGAGLQEEAFYAHRPEAPLAPASLDGLLPGRHGGGVHGAADAEGAGAAAPISAGDSDEEGGDFGNGEEGPAFGAGEGSGAGLVRGLAAALGFALRAGAMAGGVAALAVVAAKDREAFSRLASARAAHLARAAKTQI